MVLAAFLAVTLDPAIRMLFARIRPFTFKPRPLARLATSVLVGTYQREENHPISRILFRLYDRPCRLVLRFPKTTIVLAILIVLSAVPVYFKLGHEFMPPLNEGTILYMPTTMPGISVTEAQRLLETQDRIIRGFPEVISVHGKAGRSDTSTDPAPLSMMETVVALKPAAEWRTHERWYSAWAPRWLRNTLAHVWPERISWEDLVGEMDAALQIPGQVNAWTMPIKARIDMLSTGVRTPVGIKVLGGDLVVIQKIGEDIERILRPVSGTRGVFAERAAGGFFLDFEPRREALARYGLSLEDLQMTINAAIGGETITTTVEGRERYSISLRYPRDMRDDFDQLDRVLVTARLNPRPADADAAMDTSTANAGPVQVPIGELADIRLVDGPSMIRDENGMLAGYVFVDVTGRDLGGYVTDAKAAVAKELKLPAGYSLLWSGQYENMQRVTERMKLILPITLVLIVILLYLNTRSAFKTMIVILAVPFSMVGAVWFLCLLGYNVSIATWVGLIALMGLDAETGVFMLMFLDLSCKEAVEKGRLGNLTELKEAIVHGAVKRIRPKIMTVAAASIGLMPILWSIGTGADMMKRVAAPLVGGLATSFVMELLVYPAIYLLWKKRSLKESP
jgi:Cu(I)/Ag(I) efflux system membrane protein CusA/SilA